MATGRTARIRKRLDLARAQYLIDYWEEGTRGPTKWLVKPRHETTNYYSMALIEAFLDGLDSAWIRVMEYKGFVRVAEGKPMTEPDPYSVSRAPRVPR